MDKVKRKAKILQNEEKNGGRYRNKKIENRRQEDA